MRVTSSLQVRILAVVAIWAGAVMWAAPSPKAQQQPVAPSVAPAPREAPAQTVAARPVVRPASAFRPVLDQYCVTCHNSRLKTAGLALDTLDLASAPDDAATWERVIRKLNTGMMPPAGMPRPDEPTTRSLVASLEATLDQAAARAPNPGPATVHRLNRVEYANAVRDLLAVEVDVASLLPPDDAVAGFDNIADALGVSPVLLERYLSAAMKIAPLAVGTYRDGPVESIYRAPGDLNQTQHVQGLPFGTRGGLLIAHTFPVDGDYMIKATLWRNNAGRIRGLEAPHELEFLVDGERVHAVTVGTPEQFAISFDDRQNTKTTAEFDATLLVRLPVKAGPRQIGVTFASKTAAQDPQRLRPLLSPFDAVDTHGVPRVDSVSIVGPYIQTGAGETPSRARIFTCRPTSAADEAACARTIVSTLARRAYRRPVTDADLRVLLPFYEAGRAEGTFDHGIERSIIRILTSPEFLFRIERDAPNARPGVPARLSGLELASRLSFFLWSSLPDEALLEAAIGGRLNTAAGVDQQMRRMLADPRAEALVTNFAGQWLYLRNLRTVAPIADEFPDFDDDLRQAFRRETEMLFGSIIREDRSVVELLTADYTFVNERLARHYGIPRVYGSHFRRVAVREEARRGILGHGSILAVTSNANRTSPVRRGKWILENLIGSPPPPPPANVPPLTENSERARPLTMREQMEQHRANPACASCHRLMDPLGLALENFDAVGGWRVIDAGVEVDARVQLADGTSVDGAIGLRQALLRRPEVFVTTFTEKLMTYALGRPVEATDMPTLRAIVRQAAQRDYRFSALVDGIVKSAPFTMRLTAPLDRERGSDVQAARGQVE